MFFPWGMQHQLTLWFMVFPWKLIWTQWKKSANLTLTHSLHRADLWKLSNKNPRRRSPQHIAYRWTKRISAKIVGVFFLYMFFLKKQTTYGTYRFLKKKHQNNPFPMRPVTPITHHPSPMACASCLAKPGGTLLLPAMRRLWSFVASWSNWRNVLATGEATRFSKKCIGWQFLGWAWFSQDEAFGVWVFFSPVDTVRSQKNGQCIIKSRNPSKLSIYFRFVWFSPRKKQQNTYNWGSQNDPHWWWIPFFTRFPPGGESKALPCCT